MLVLALVISTSFSTTTFAQTPANPCDTSKDDTLYYFKTLFCGSVVATPQDGKPLDPRTPTQTGFTNTDGSQSISPVVNKDTTTIGLKNINVGVWLVMDPNKNLFGWWKKGIGDPADPTGYFFDLVAKDESGGENNKFLLRTEYTKKDGSKHYVYTGITARELKKDATITNGDLKQIAFFEENSGSTKQKIVTHQQVRSTVTFPEDVAYGSEVNIDFWYCGGSSDENYKIASNNDWVISSSDVNWPSRDNAIGGLKTSDGKSYRKDSNLTKEIFGTAKLDKNNVLFMNGGKDEHGDEKTKLCGGTAYYKITPTTSWVLPKDLPTAQSNELVRQDAGIQATVTQEGTMPECGIVSGSILGCVAQIIYGLIFKPLSWIAALFGYLFDFFIGYSLSDESYRMGFAVTGWQLVRDISNIFFIIILVWTGFATVFGISGISMKKVVPALLINAIIINFSLFATRAIIDLSNIVARVFYGQIAVCDNPTCAVNPLTGKVEYKRGVGGYWPLSEKIVASFNPQKIMTPSVLEPRPAGAVDKDGKAVDASSTSSSFDSNTSDAKSAEAAAAGMSRSSSEYAAYFILVTIIGSAIMFGIAMMFWKVSFMFLGRVIGLYICMIFAPFAFLTRGNLPLVSGIKELSFSKWLNDLTNYALLAPIFVFFLYIIYSFLQTDFMNEFTGASSATDFFTNVLWITIPMLFIYSLIDQGVTIAKKYAGEMGNKIQAFGEKAVGLVGGAALGVATGGAALGLRGLASGGGKILAKSGLTDKIAARADNSWGFRKLNQGIKWSQTSSLDLRDTKANNLFNKGLKSFGIDAKDNLSGRIKLGELNLGQGAYKGGIKKIQEDRIKAKGKDVDTAMDFSHLSDDQSKAAWEKNKAAKGDKAWESSENTKRQESDTALKALKDEEKVIQGLIEKASVAGDGATVINQSAKLKQNQNNQKKSIKAIERMVSVEKKKGAHTDSDAYKAAIAAIDAKHGTIEKTKDFTEAMRIQYMENLLEDSLLLSKGDKDRKFRAGAAILGGVAGGAGTSLLVGNWVDSHQEAEKSAFSERIKKYGKSRGASIKKEARLKANRDRIEEELKESEDLIFEAIKKYGSDKDKQASSIESIDYANQKAAVEEMLTILEKEKNKSDAEYESLKKELETPPKVVVAGFGAQPSNTGDPVAILEGKKNAAYIKQKEASDKFNNMKNVLSKRAKATKDMTSYYDKEDREVIAKEKAASAKEKAAPKTDEPKVK